MEEEKKVMEEAQDEEFTVETEEEASEE